MSGVTLLNSFLFGLGLAFESFMVSLANGLNNANLRILRAFGYATLFAACHVVALAVGYALVISVSGNIATASGYLTWIAVGVSALLGTKMIIEGVRVSRGHTEKSVSSTIEFFIQSVVASFDAFAVGLTLPEYSVGETVLCAAIIAAVITAFYIIGFAVGKKFGTKLGKYAAIIGGVVFIGVAIEITVGALI